MRGGVWLALLVCGAQALGQTALEQEAVRLTKDLRVFDQYARVLTTEEWVARHSGVPEALSAEILRGRKATGYIRIKNFRSSGSCAKFRDHLVEFRRKHVQRLIIDLRGNPGGQRMAAICITGLLTGPEKIAGFRDVKPSIPNLTDWIDDEGLAADSGITWIPSLTPAEFSGPVAVLISRSSASAAEMMAAALRDHRRAWLIGGRTFGKGMIQDHAPVKGRPELILGFTSQQFYSPNGESPERLGVRPTFLPDKISACVSLKSWVNQDDFERALALAVLDCAGNEPVPPYEIR